MGLSLGIDCRAMIVFTTQARLYRLRTQQISHLFHLQKHHDQLASTTGLHIYQIILIAAMTSLSLIVTKPILPLVVKCSHWAAIILGSNYCYCIQVPQLRNCSSLLCEPILINVSDSVWPHRRQPTRLPRPWDSPGKNTGVGCHFLRQLMNLTLSNFMVPPPLSDVFSFHSYTCVMLQTKCLHPLP